MLRKMATVVTSTLLAISLCACGSNAGNSSDGSSNDTSASAPATETQAKSSEQLAEEETGIPFEKEEPQEEEEYDPMVSNIDLTLDGGSIRFDHVEKANEELTDSDNALVFVFDFTNAQSTPAQAQSVFRFQFFQNDTELTNNLTYYDKGGDQYELVGAFFNEALKGGTVRFGKIVEPKDDSPITIMVSPNGAALDENYQMMEVALDGSQPSSGESPDLPTEEVDAALQGTWSMGDDGEWTFDQGSVTFASEKSLSGTYEIDADASAIVLHLEATDGTVKARLPFEYDGNALKVFKNTDKAEELTKI